MWSDLSLFAVQRVVGSNHCRPQWLVRVPTDDPFAPAVSVVAGVDEPDDSGGRDAEVVALRPLASDPGSSASGR